MENLDYGQHLPADTTYPVGLGNGTAASRARPEDRTGTRPLRTEAEIFKARWKITSQLKTASTANDLPWERLTDDAEYRADFICALFDLYRTHRPHLGAHQPSPQQYGSGFDGSEGNSGHDRDFDPCPWL